MENQTLKQKIIVEEQKVMGTCPECGKEYNLQERQEQKEIKNLPKPNTAPDYCCNNPCWIRGVAAQEYA